MREEPHIPLEQKTPKKNQKKGAECFRGQLSLQQRTGVVGGQAVTCAG